MSKASKRLRAQRHRQTVTVAIAFSVEYAQLLQDGKRKKKVKSQGVGTSPTGKRNHANKDSKTGLASRELHAHGKQVLADDNTAAQASTNFKPPCTPKWAASKVLTEKNRRKAGKIK